MYYILYNRKAGAKKDNEKFRQAADFTEGDRSFINMADIASYEAFFEKLTAEDTLVLCGGDGTLNYFINKTDGLTFEGEILYFPCGSGNDFAADFGHQRYAAPFSIKEHLKNLPYVIVNGKTYRFLNGVGFGIDGYCCEVGDKQKKKSEKPVNYTAIAIKGLLFHYKPTKARITVDGFTTYYKKVWIAPTMYGKHYGDGMMPTPQQQRGSKQLSTMVFYGSGKLKTLMIFPSIFKGEHIKHTKQVDVLRGEEITVEFDRPTALQIDGETILGVTSYTAKTYAAMQRQS